MHEDYDNLLNLYDLALIRVDTIVPMSWEKAATSLIIPVCLPWQPNDPGRSLQAGDELTVTGWGQTSQDSIRTIEDLLNSTADVLQVVQLPYVDCTTRHGHVLLNNSIHMCAGNEMGRDSCNMDSGGPLVFRKDEDKYVCDCQPIIKCEEVIQERKIRYPRMTTCSDFNDDDFNDLKFCCTPVTQPSVQPWYQVGIVNFGTTPCGIGHFGVYARVSAFLSWIEDHLEP